MLATVAGVTEDKIIVDNYRTSGGVSKVTSKAQYQLHLWKYNWAYWGHPFRSPLFRLSKITRISSMNDQRNLHSTAFGISLLYLTNANSFDSSSVWGN